MQNRPVHHLIGTNYVVHYQSVGRFTTTLWTLICMFVVKHKYVPLVHHGAQRRLVVHNGGRWCTALSCTHKPRQTHTQAGPILLPRPLAREVNMENRLNTMSWHTCGLAFGYISKLDRDACKTLKTTGHVRSKFLGRDISIPWPRTVNIDTIEDMELLLIDLNSFYPSHWPYILLRGLERLTNCLQILNQQTDYSQGKVICQVVVSL